MCRATPALLVLLVGCASAIREDVREEARRVDHALPAVRYFVEPGPDSPLEGTSLWRAGQRGSDEPAHACFVHDGDVFCGPDPRAFEEVVRIHELGAKPGAIDDAAWVRLWVFAAGLDPSSTGRVERPDGGGVVLRVEHDRGRDPTSGLDRMEVDVVTVSQGGSVRLERSTVEAQSPGPRGEVTAGTPEPDPGPPTHADGTAASAEDEVRGCYEHALVRVSDLRGEIAVRLVVGRDGRPTHLAIARSDLRDEELARCVLTVVRSWRFAEPAAGRPETVTWSFALSPELD